jgi:probable phosphoglycerate mutase
LTQNPENETMRLYIIRHGDPNYTDDCLTETGRGEAAALADYLAWLGVERLYASPLGRAQETAQAAAQRLNLPIETLEWTRELRGPRLKGSRFPAWDIGGVEVRKDGYLSDPNRWELLDEYVDAEQLREASAAVARSSDEFLAGLGYERSGSIYRVTRPNRLKIAVVCHGGFGLTWLAHLLAIPLPLIYGAFFIQTTSVTTLLFEERVQGSACPRCIEFGALPHLYQAGLRPAYSGLLANHD